MLNLKKILCGGLITAMCIASFAGCGSSTSSSSSADSSSSGVAGKTISVVSREDGSGTRGAFTELTGVAEKDASGQTNDNTTADAEIANSTAVVATTVAGNKAAIGYISLGSLDDTVRAVKVDGVEATAENVKNGSYKVSRPFNIVTKSGLSAVATDFINYIMSPDGQAEVEKDGYVSVGEGQAYTASGLSGKVSVAGSSSVTPVMQSLAEAYMKLNPDVTVEVEQSDSTTGVTSAVDGVCDIGMASRELKDSETSQGVTSKAIAMDGIAIIVNKANTIDNLSMNQIKSIYTGETTRWDDVIGK